MITEADVAGGVATLKAWYIRGNRLVARKDEQGKAYYLHNGHGDVVGLMDASGQMRLNSYSYDIWGNIASQREGVPQPFKYSGELWDSTTSLQYLRARWYDPSMGRFINEDTYEGQIDNPLSLNLYTYVENNPLIHTDPSGHKAIARVSGFLDSFANTITFGGYGYVMGKIDSAFGRVQEDPDYYDGQIWGYSVIETGSAYAAAAGAVGAGGGSATCFATAGAGCAIAAGSAGVAVLAGYQGTFASMMNDQASDLYQFYKAKSEGSSGGVNVGYGGTNVPVYRGGSGFKLKDGEYRIDKETGMVKDTHGVSLDVNPATVSKFGGAYKLDSLPDGLKIIQRGSRAEHFEIVPSRAMKIDEFQSLLDKIKVSAVE